jgi:hypothetical protein
MAPKPAAAPTKADVEARIRAAAARALAEAQTRQQARPVLPPERGGRAGPEPTRYGDWEKGGLAIDF